MQTVDIVVRQIDLDDDLQAVERVRINVLNAAIAQHQLMQIHQFDLDERVLNEASYAIAAQIEILDLGRKVLRHLREVQLNTFGGLLAGHPFALALVQRRALHPVLLALTQGNRKRCAEQPPAHCSRYHSRGILLTAETCATTLERDCDTATAKLT